MARIRRRRRAQEEESAPGELDAVAAQVSKNFGGHVMHLASAKPVWKHCSTGIVPLDVALFGGIPEGLVTLIYGRESSGKTTLALRIIAEYQKKHPARRAVFMDIEGTYDARWAERHGVDNNRVYLLQPQTGEQGLELVSHVLRAEETGIVVVDSLAALLPFKEGDAHIEDQQPGIQARLIGKFCRRVQNVLLDERGKDHWPTVIFLNQFRMKIGVFMGDPRVLPGGHAQHYVAAVKIEMSNKETLGENQNDMQTVAFNSHGFKITKCKIGTGIRHGEFKMVRDPSHELGEGFVDDGKTLATWMKKMGLITGGGGHYRIEGVEGTFRNVDSMVSYLYEDRDEFMRCKRLLIARQREACGLVASGWE